MERFRLRKLDGVVQVALAVALIGAIIWACKPATLHRPAEKGHDPATCEVCRHPNSHRVAGGHTGADPSQATHSPSDTR